MISPEKYKICYENAILDTKLYPQKREMNSKILSIESVLTYLTINKTWFLKQLHCRKKKESCGDLISEQNK